MKIHRFITDLDLNSKIIMIRDFKLANQISGVLRIKPRENIILADGKSNEVLAEIQKVGRGFVEAEVKKYFKNKNESKIETNLYCSILKKENFELVAQKATEIGIKKIVPFISKRTVKFDIKKERLNKIIKESSEQSGRGIIPQLGSIADFEQALEDASYLGLKILFDQRGLPLKSYEILPRNICGVGIFIGPEGGFEKEEISLAQERGIKIVSLGKFTLRSETAAIVGSSFALNYVR